MVYRKYKINKNNVNEAIALKIPLAIILEVIYFI